MSDQIRFICGEFNKCSLGTPKTIQSKRNPGETFTQYSVKVDGFFEDNSEPVDMFLNSSYPVTVFMGDGDDPINPAEADGKVFKGRAMVKERTLDDGSKRYYLQAVCITDEIGEDDNGIKENPFKMNPLV